MLTGIIILCYHPIILPTTTTDRCRTYRTAFADSGLDCSINGFYALVNFHYLCLIR